LLPESTTAPIRATSYLVEVGLAEAGESAEFDAEFFR
jgi:hypothetical protein